MPELIIFFSTQNGRTKKSEKFSFIDGFLAIGHLGKAGNKERELACAGFSTSSQMLLVSLESACKVFHRHEFDGIEWKSWERLVQAKGLLLAETGNSLSPFADIALNLFDEVSEEAHRPTDREKKAAFKVLYPILIDQVEAGKWFPLPMNDEKFLKYVQPKNSEAVKNDQLIEPKITIWSDWILKAVFAKNASPQYSLLMGYLWLIHELTVKYPGEIELYYHN